MEQRIIEKYNLKSPGFVIGLEEVEDFFKMSEVFKTDEEFDDGLLEYFISKLKLKINQVELTQEDKCELLHYLIDSILDDSQYLRSYFLENNTIKSYARRFIKSVKDRSISESQKWINDLKKIMNESTLKTVNSIKLSLSNSIKVINQDFLDTIASISEPIASNLLKIIQSFQEEVQSYINQCEESVIVNARNGWTLDYTYLSKTSKPDSFLKGSSLYRKYLNNYNFENLIDHIKLFSKINDSKLDDIVFCYKHGQNYVCCMVIFSLIDSLILEVQRIDGKQRRKLGVKARNDIIGTINENGYNTIKEWLFVKNYSQCCEEFYKNANDFVIQPTIINRNFLMHGMYKRKVTKKDCIRLFLFLYNTVNLLEYFDVKVETLKSFEELNLSEINKKRR